MGKRKRGTGGHPKSGGSLSNEDFAKARANKKGRAETGDGDSYSYVSTPLDMENEHFNLYYKKNEIVGSEEEWKEFLDAAHRPLPTTFRISKITPFHSMLREQIRSSYVPLLRTANLEDVPEGKDPLCPMEWYPDELGWYFVYSKMKIRKNRDNKALDEFHQFLHSQTGMGHFSRQEAVSMIPPFFLQVEPHHAVLDMCAAPGSKTTQIIEFLHEEALSDDSKVPVGLVVANDVDEKRCHLLVHQTKRLNSPCVVITRFAAQMFPTLKYTVTEDGVEKEKRFLFDRILCDVPCTGDGTTRKNPDVWGKWNTGAGHGMHRLQLQIAQRGVRLLKRGGRLVYSTCSMNPIENEAVVAEILRRCPQVELVDVSDSLPGLKRAKAMTKWHVYDSNAQEPAWYENKEDLPLRRQRKIPPSCFSPTEEEVAKFHLERCVRVFHHLQDTGAFFIAVFQNNADFIPDENEKVAAGSEAQTGEEGGEKEGEGKGKEAEASTPMDIDEKKEAAAETPTASNEAVDQSESVSRTEIEQSNATEKSTVGPGVSIDPSSLEYFVPRRRDEAPYLPMGPEWQEDIDAFTKQFGLKDTFPIGQVMSRSEGRGKSLYFISEGVREFLRADRKGVLHIVNTGVKIFSRTAPFQYRLGNEGLPVIYPYITKRIIPMGVSDLEVYFTEENPLWEKFSPEVAKQLSTVGQGSIVIPVHFDGLKVKETLIAGWVGKASTHLMVSKVDQTGLKQLVQFTKEQGELSQVDEGSSGQAGATEMIEN